MWRTPDFWSQKSGLRHIIWQIILMPLAWLYCFAGWLRQKWVRPQKSPVPVICVGNITIGGAGKTPIALMLAQYAQQKGRHPVILSRGYGGNTAGPLWVDKNKHTAQMTGDEALMLAMQDIDVIIAGNRRKAIRYVLDNPHTQKADIFIMDDGLQNPSLAKQFSIAVIDAGYGFGNGRIFPAGPLREPVARALRKSHAVWLMQEMPIVSDKHHTTQNDMTENNTTQKHTAQIAPLLPKAELMGVTEFCKQHNIPIYHGWLAPIIDADNIARLQEQPVFAYCGIGRAEKFFHMLQQMGLTLAGQRAFPDHHPYREAEAEQLLQDAQRLNARLLTTAKDKARFGQAQTSAGKRLAEASETIYIAAQCQQADAFFAQIDAICGWS